MTFDGRVFAYGSILGYRTAGKKDGHLVGAEVDIVVEL
jgi:hypothetical protein